MEGKMVYLDIPGGTGLPLELSPPNTDVVPPPPKDDARRTGGIKTLLSVVTNKSRAQRVAQAVCGPLGRVWDRDGVVQVGEQRPDGREVYGQGKTYEEAFLDAARELTLEDFVRLAGKEIRAIAIQSDALTRARMGLG